MTGILITELSHFGNGGYRWSAPAEPILRVHTCIQQT